MTNDQDPATPSHRPADSFPPTGGPQRPAGAARQAVHALRAGLSSLVPPAVPANLPPQAAEGLADERSSTADAPRLFPQFATVEIRQPQADAEFVDQLLQAHLVPPAAAPGSPIRPAAGSSEPQRGPQAPSFDLTSQLLALDIPDARMVMSTGTFASPRVDPTGPHAVEAGLGTLGDSATSLLTTEATGPLVDDPTWVPLDRQARRWASVERAIGAGPAADPPADYFLGIADALLDPSQSPSRTGGGSPRSASPAELAGPAAPAPSPATSQAPGAGTGHYTDYLKRHQSSDRASGFSTNTNAGTSSSPSSPTSSNSAGRTPG